MEDLGYINNTELNRVKGTYAEEADGDIRSDEDATNGDTGTDGDSVDDVDQEEAIDGDTRPDDDNVDDADEEFDSYSEDGNVDRVIEEGIIINGHADVVNFDMKNISIEDVYRLDFLDLEVAYLFYSWYAKVNGFAPRKDKMLRRAKDRMIVQQQFVCSREGHPDKRGVIEENRKRQERKSARCGCPARFRVHVDIESGRWYVTLFDDGHTHDLMPDMLGTLIPGNRNISDADKAVIENLRKVGIRAPHIYGAIANSAGGYHKAGFIMKDLYNQIGKQRRREKSDAKGAVRFLRRMKLHDPLMYVKYTLDASGRLQRLFWSDGESQMNYKIFGDVLAFDATYKKNRNKCPVVVFSGINHHNQTTVFATAIITTETEDTYVWLLQHFLKVMKNKSPCSVITDGDLAMKNSINKVFPDARHRLCAWHLLRNATSNVGNVEMMPYLKQCMFGDYNVSHFEKIWNEMITTLRLEDNSWLKDLYARKHMWATAHIRGDFFAGIRTTSRCEALHSHMKKYVHSKIGLSDFVKQYQRCLNYFRFNEVVADYRSEYGQVKLQTSLELLESSGSKQYSNEIFLLYRQVLKKASKIDVLERHEMSMCSIFSVLKYRGSGTIWKVSFCPSPMEFRCTCLRMESIGLPCEHTIAVLRFLHFDVLPVCLVLKRWSKSAKDQIRGTYPDGSLYWDSYLVARYANLVHLCKQLSELASRDEVDYNHIIDVVTTELEKLKLKHGNVDDADKDGDDDPFDPLGDVILDPPIVRTKGCGSSKTQGKRPHKCSLCGEVGHNRRSCPNRGHVSKDAVHTNLEEPNTAGGEYSNFNSQQCDEDPDTLMSPSSQL